jgi:hypothetical protein
MNIKLGQIKKVENTKRHFGSTTEYNVVYVETNGKIIPLCLTNTEFEAGKTRASNNKEDLPSLKVSFFKWLFS